MGHSESSSSQAAPLEASRASEGDKPNGPPLAALMAAAVGTFVLGAITTLAEVSEGLKDWLVFREPVGPLSGKTTLATGVWLVAWVVLGLAWRGKELDTRKVLITSVVLIVLGVIGTYPTFFEQFAPE